VKRIKKRLSGKEKRLKFIREMRNQRNKKKFNNKFENPKSKK